jgi:DNA repair exonuclease SbcCD ATPase subunit
MSTEKDTWAEYSRLVLKELERLNDNHEKMRNDIDGRFSQLYQKISDLNQKISDLKNIESKVDAHVTWIEKVNDVWSPSQMKSAKDEIYAQKNKWIAAIAILGFIQVLTGIVIAVWGKF